ncbi:hypothetical protein EJ110_NYTH11751 [Nymphaea thermarum]|nr:hypothetical protein EJ110_NYTH11751 [Nymphaea thermarum]
MSLRHASRVCLAYGGRAFQALKDQAPKREVTAKIGGRKDAVTSRQARRVSAAMEPVKRRATDEKNRRAEESLRTVMNRFGFQTKPYGYGAGPTDPTRSEKFNTRGRKRAASKYFFFDGSGSGLSGPDPVRPKLIARASSPTLACRTAGGRWSSAGRPPNSVGGRRRAPPGPPEAGHRLTVGRLPPKRRNPAVLGPIAFCPLFSYIRAAEATARSHRQAEGGHQLVARLHLATVDSPARQDVAGQREPPAGHPTTWVVAGGTCQGGQRSADAHLNGLNPAARPCRRQGMLLALKRNALPSIGRDKIKMIERRRSIANGKELEGSMGIRGLLMIPSGSLPLAMAILLSIHLILSQPVRQQDVQLRGPP